MTQLALYVIALTGLAIPLGFYMARIFDGSAGQPQRKLNRIEGMLYRIFEINPENEMNWKQYAIAMLLFNFIGLLFVYAVQRLQDVLPFNPQNFAAVSPDSSLNTAVSFASNTNWQGYAGETTMSFLTQMIALSVQNFVSAAAGICVLLALIRGLVRRETTQLGNFWVDLVRSTIYVLLPLSVVLAIVLISQGVPQTFRPFETVTLLQSTSDAAGKVVTEQTIALGPVASQIAIKQLGTNGGGFYNVNSAHPFENPTPIANFLELVAILLIPAALCFTFGKMVKDMRQGWAVYAAMLFIFLGCTVGCIWAEQRGNPAFSAMSIDQGEHEPDYAVRDALAAVQAGGNMEGKETRFGPVNSAIWATATTAASNGSVNSMHDSFTPLGGLIPMWLIQLGEVVFGGVGSGLYGMLVFAILTVFIAGLMVGRTPEYLGKKIEAFEMKMASIVILIPPLTVLIGTAIASITKAGTSSLANPGAHGFSEMLYAFSSTANNNGSAFAGLNANTVFYNLLGALTMLIGRFWLAVPVLAIAGSLAQKKTVPAGSGTLETHSPLFVTLLIAIVMVVGALSFIPALALGPIVEQLQAAR
jgi:K+-transporting ATPase ATPase A chain